jgi:hypothetical protein
MPKKESENIMEKLMSKMVHRPSQIAQEKAKQMNKQIEKVFELDVFQRIVDNADQSTLLSDISSSS